MYIYRENAIKALYNKKRNLLAMDADRVANGVQVSIKVIESLPSADRPQDDCETCEHYNNIGDWCRTCGVSHYTPRMKGADDETD